MTPLDSEHLSMTIAFYRKLTAQVNDKVKALAVKMGVDPDADLVIVPKKIAGEGELPKWMTASNARFDTKEIILIQGARKRNRAQPRSKINGRE